MSDQTSTDLYDGYDAWKGWNKPFTCPPEEELYFEGETRDLAIANSDVLEIGFGSGSFLVWAKARGARIAGTEINPNLLKAAQDYGLELINPSFEEVATQYAGRFDTIAAFDVFEHFPVADIVTRLGAAQTMLKAGGHLILRFPNAQSPFGLPPQNGDPTHKAALSRSVFEQLLQGTKFEITRYAPSYRIGGGSLPKRIVRELRYFVRDLISKTLNFVYSQEIPWDPVVVLVLRRKA